MTLRLHTAPTELPLTLAEVKLDRRVEHAVDDDLLQALIYAATQAAEHLMGRAIMPQKWELSQACFPSCSRAIALQRPKVTEVDSITYVSNDSGADVVLAPEAYRAALASDFTASVSPVYGTAWPVARVQPESVRIIFSCGYADAAAVPELVKAWIKQRVGALYENREAWTLGKKIEANPHVDGLLDRYRTWLM